jgi:tetratricopeptide (TPR) repeat protein
MGEEHTWKRKHLFFCCACCLSALFGLIGCIQPAKESQGRQNLKEVESLRESDRFEASMQQTRQGKQNLREAETLMGSGEYEASMQETLSVLEAHPMTLGDQALFLMGLLNAHPENPQADYDKAIVCFERIIREFPLSEKKEEARLWFLTLRHREEELGQLRMKVKGIEQASEAKEKKLKSLQEELEERERKLTEEQNEIDQLRNRVAELEAQLSKLKNVDLTIEKKKRAPQP